MKSNEAYAFVALLFFIFAVGGLVAAEVREAKKEIIAEIRKLAPPRGPERGSGK